MLLITLLMMFWRCVLLISNSRSLDMLKLVRTSASHHSPPTTHHHRCCRRHHNHLLFQLLLKVFIVARVISKRLNPGAAEDWRKTCSLFVFICQRQNPRNACP